VKPHAAERTSSAGIVPGKVGIATVLFNSGAVLPEFLQSLEAQTHRNFVVYAVDNASADDSAEKCKQAGDRFVVTINEQNTGFAHGTNQGIQQALADGCEFIFLLNNDVVFEADFLHELMQGMERTGADIAAPLTFYHDRPEVIWAAGGTFQRWAGYRPIHLGMGQTDGGQFAEDRPIQFSPGSGLLARRHVFERIGLLDEAYFTYWEDTDFSVRALKAGLKSYLIPKARLWHKVSSLTGMRSDFQRFYAVRNHALYIAKHCGVFHAQLLHAAYLVSYRITGLLRHRTDERVKVWKEGMAIARSAQNSRVGRASR
jgi:GT2 family glycosyltransferase